MSFILMNHSEGGGKFSKMCPCHDLSCKCRDQGQMGETGPAGGCQESPSLAEETGLLTASATNRLCGLERIASLSEPSFLVSQSGGFRRQHCSWRNRRVKASASR